MNKEARESGPFSCRVAKAKRAHRRQLTRVMVGSARTAFAHPTTPEISMFRFSIFIGATASLLASVLSAAAQQPMQRVQVGVLECRGGASIGFIVGSVTNLGCVLRVSGLPDDSYVATIRKVGLDIGITQESALAWAVYAPVARLGPGDLSGNYAGAQGSASIGVGLGGNVLVGGSANSIALQPLSVQGQVGLNLALGVEGLELRPGR
jgi:hypothetical protein